MKNATLPIVQIPVLAVLSLLITERSAAHHSPAQYEQFDIVEKVAKVVRFDFRNPHSYILVRDTEGGEWVLETSSAVRLRRMGWNDDLFSPGDDISFRAHANRDPQKIRLYLSSVTPANGETYVLLEGDDDPPEPPPVAIATSLEGVWRVDTSNFDEIYDGFDAHPMTDKAERAIAAYDETMDPVADCIAYPTPQLVMVSFIYPMRIEIAEEKVIFHHEFYNTTRTVYMDGRGHPAGTPRTNQGHSVGSWDDKTLVVDTRYFADHRNPMLGEFPSGAGKHVVERYTLSDEGTHATVDIFVEDPEYLVEPMRYTLKLLSAPNEELQDFDCDPESARRYTQ